MHLSSNKIKENFSYKDVESIINRIDDLKILIIGDTIIDEYNYVSFLGKPSKENIASTLYEKTEKKAGGVLTAINILSSFCNNIDYISVMGDNEDDEKFISEYSAKNINKKIIFKRHYPTTKKSRFIIGGKQIRKLFEVYEMNDELIEHAIESQILKYLDKNLSDYDLVIVQDYGHGLITNKIISKLASKSNFLAVNAQINSGNFGYNIITKYQQAEYYCLDLPEARMAVNSKYMEPEVIPKKLLDITKGRYVAMTMGKEGSISCNAYGEGCHSPALENEGKIVDTMSAGDSYYALSAPVLFLSSSIQLAALAGNIAGAMKVGISGMHDHIDKKVFLKKIKSQINS
jgi:bifunctional ADP-heptose synthase (sugar kinase/adenylyltransferase)